MIPDPEMTLDRATRALEMGNTHRAIELLRELLSYDPDHARGHATLALSLHEQKRLVAAEHEVNRALALGPEAPFTHLVAGHVAISQGSFARAETHLALARAGDPSNVHVLFATARLRELEGKSKQALEALERARALEPDDPRALAALGDAYRIRGRWDEAEQLARESLAQDAEHAEALVLMGHVLLHRGNVAAAREHALAVLETNANDTDALVLLAAAKARTSVLLGLWWRYNVFMTSLGATRGMLVLLAAFGIYRVTLLALEGSRHEGKRDLVMVVWVVACLYTWIAPGLFRRAVDKELGKVELRDDF